MFVWSLQKFIEVIKVGVSGVQGLGSMGHGVWDLGSKVWGLGCRVWDLGSGSAV